MQNKDNGNAMKSLTATEQLQKELTQKLQEGPVVEDYKEQTKLLEAFLPPVEHFNFKANRRWALFSK